MNSICRWIAIMALLTCSAMSLAQPNVRVVGLFPNAAVLSIDGQRTLVKAGQTGPHGVEVISADSRSAVLKVNGQTSTYTLSRDYGSGGFATPERQRLTISKGAAGHYWVTGSVNGNNVPFLVDTGATSVAINAAQAQRLGLILKTAAHRLWLTPPVALSKRGGCSLIASKWALLKC